MKTKLEFVAKTSKMGAKNIIWIPPKYHDYIDKELGKQEVFVTVEETDEEPENNRIVAQKARRAREKRHG